MEKIRLLFQLLLFIVLIHLVPGKPKATNDVGLHISKPDPGELVNKYKSQKVSQPDHHETIGRPESSVSSAAVPEESLSREENSFSSSHKIIPYRPPLAKRSADSIPVSGDELEYSHKSDTLETQATKEFVGDEFAETKQKTRKTEEVRTEYSVVTSKPRKYVPEIKIEPEGSSGTVSVKPVGTDEINVMKEKNNTESGNFHSIVYDNINSTESGHISNIEIKPMSQVGVNIQNSDPETTVPLQIKHIVDSERENEPKEVTTTTVSPLTSTTTSPKKSNIEVIPVNLVQEKSKPKDSYNLDFEDSPLSDKLLVLSGSANNQQSRIEIKKGPNGQDYEYEYVYYYYDDDDENATDSTGSAAGKKSSEQPIISSTTTAATTTQRTSTSGKRYLPTSNNDNDDTYSETNTRGRSRNRNQPQGTVEQPSNFDDTSKSTNGRNRYTTIERNRGDTVSTVAPEASNEILPPSRGSRFRGRQLNVQTTTPESQTPVAEERLPTNTRFPPRSRSNHNSATVTTPAQDENTYTRGRSSGNVAAAPTNSVRRPSLELVDSSSFRTHSSDASRNQDFAAQPPSFPSVLPAGVTPNEDADKEARRHNNRHRGRGDQLPETSVSEEQKDSSSGRRGPHIRRPSTTASPLEDDDGIAGKDYLPIENTSNTRIPVSQDEKSETVTAFPEADITVDDGVSTTERDVGLTAAIMDKAAFDLYAILQQAQAENASNFIEDNGTESSIDLDEEKDSTTDEDITTTVAFTTVTTTTTTTTTTTETPTTTSTTTTTTEPPAHSSAKRYRNRGGNTRVGANTQLKFRSSGVTTSTTEAISTESTPKTRGRFGNNRVTSGTPSFGRRGHNKVKLVEEEEDSLKEENKAVTATTPKSTGFSRGRFGASRNTRVTTTAAPVSTTASSGTAAAARPTFSDRYNLRRRGGSRVTTASPSHDESRDESGNAEENSESSTVSSVSTASGSKVTGRVRLNSAGGPRPLRPGPKINIGGRPRPGAAPIPAITSAPAPVVENVQETEEKANHSTIDAIPRVESQEPQEAVTTPVPDALTRLRSRPRLQVTSGAKTTAAPAAANNNRHHLVSSLLPKRRPGHPLVNAKESETGPVEGQSESELPPKPSKEEIPEADEGNVTPAAAASEPEEAPKENRLSSLLSGRRRAAIRKPGSLLPLSNKQTNQDAA